MHVCYDLYRFLYMLMYVSIDLSIYKLKFSVYTCISMSVCTCACMFLSTCLSINAHACFYPSICLYMRMYVSIHLSVCICACMFLSVSVMKHVSQNHIAKRPVKTPMSLLSEQSLFIQNVI